MWNFKDLTGQRFGALTVTGRDFSVPVEKRVYWLCQCDCGVIKSIRSTDFTRKLNPTKSCGCRINMKNKLPGGRTRLYQIWNQMIQRCENPKNDAYHNYGGRGIKIHPSWHDYRNFHKDAAEGYRDDLTIDRINNEGNYEPGNTRWVTRTFNCRNTRRIKLNEQQVKEIRMSPHLSALELAKKYGVSRCSIYAIINFKVWK